jgi:enterochelin esterase family protein
MGPSLGANISGLIAYEHPEIFGNCGLHSPAFWVNDFEVSRWYTDSIPKDVRLYWVAGTYEDLGIDWQTFSDSLDKKGYIFDGNIYHEGHSWGLWRATCDEMLTFFFPKGSTPVGVKAIEQNYYNLGQNYPNPFGLTTTIPFNVSGTNHVMLKVYTVQGQEVATLVNGIKKPGSYDVMWDAKSFPGGVYFYALEAGSCAVSRKMVVVR